MPRLGLVGFANSGKSTVFNALTGLSSPTASHPHSTVQPQPGVALVPDPLLDKAALVERSAKTTHATLDLLDLPPLSESASGETLGRVRDVDALLMVVRSFADPSVPAGEGGTDPIEQADRLLLQLTLADHDVFERRLQRLEKEAGPDPSKRPTLAVVEEAASLLGSGGALRSQAWDDDALQVLHEMGALTIKPAVWLANVGEDENGTMGWEARLRSVVPSGDEVVAASALLEEEAAQVDSEARAELLSGLGLGAGVLARVVGAAYASLGLISFYTLGPKEARAWTVRRGATASEAAGKIHTDLERGFIRAEVCTLEHAISAGGFEAAKKAGMVRVEGKAYEVAEGDVLLIRFSV
ncbi:MAG TPA: DUF933 domain-containing protein [Acidimicrobiia bacterium]